MAEAKGCVDDDRPGASPVVATPWLNRLFQFLGCSEGDLLARFDFDGLAGSWISTHPSRMILDLRDAETGQPDFVAVLKVVGGERYQITQDSFGLLLRQVMALGQFGSHLPERDGSPRRCLV